MKIVKPKRRVVIDTNVISSGIGDLERPQLDAVATADLSREHIYTKEVDDELSRVKNSKPARHRNPFFEYNIMAYRLVKKVCVVDNKIDHEKELNNPAKNRDKRILRAAVWAKADTIVTLDKKFRKKADNYMGLRLIKPDEYLRIRTEKDKVKDK